MNKDLNNSIALTARMLAMFSLAILLSGCASLGKGVTEAILEKSDNEDTRLCQVWGKPFLWKPLRTKGCNRPTSAWQYAHEC